MIEFNINEYVWIKLTEYGRGVHRRNHDQLFSSWRGKPPAYTPPIEDTDGWSRWQLWCVMQEFGPHISMSGHACFETTIRLKDSQK